MAIDPNDPTSHGLTPSEANVVSGSVGANIAPVFVCCLTALICILDFILEGADVMCIRGPSTAGETFLLFRDAWLSRESDPELLASESEEPDCSDESDASLDRCAIAAEAACAVGAIVISGLRMEGVVDYLVELFSCTRAVKHPCQTDASEGFRRVKPQLPPALGSCWTVLAVLLCYCATVPCRLQEMMRMP